MSSIAPSHADDDARVVAAMLAAFEQLMNELITQHNTRNKYALTLSQKQDAAGRNVEPTSDERAWLNRLSKNIRQKEESAVEMAFRMDVLVVAPATDPIHGQLRAMRRRYNAEFTDYARLSLCIGPECDADRAALRLRFETTSAEISALRQEGIRFHALRQAE